MAQEAKIRLLGLVDRARSGRGLTSSREDRAEILQAVQDLAKAANGSNTTGSFASGTWELLYTTEKETLFIMKNANWFGTEAGAVYQIIDMQEQYLQNVITFPPDGAFVVDSSVKAAGPQRVQFQFTSAKLMLPDDKNWNLPPFGQGWFENVFLDRDIRISMDSRGDTLITRRAGPPVRFE